MTPPSTTDLTEGATDPGTPKIRLEGVGKIYPGTKIPAVDELTLDIKQGEILVLVGPSGCGKSTTLRLINRMIEPTSGKILLDGEHVINVDANKLRRRIGYVIQQIGLFPHQTIAQNIATVPKMIGWDKDRIKKRSDELLETVGLDPERFRDRYPKELSGGQAQRVGVARALSADPDIMLMDEPFGAIDPITRERLQNEFLRLQAELQKTIVFVTHDIDEAIKMGDRIAILGERSVIKQIDTPQRILANPADDFVRDFIGSGSTIKGLNFQQVDALAPSDYPTLKPSESADEGRSRIDGSSGDWLVLLDDSGAPKRWLHRDDLDGDSGSLSSKGQPVEHKLKPNDSLFQALEQMVQNAGGTACVVDEQGRFTGVVDVSHLTAAVSRAQAEARENAGATS